MGWGGGGCYKVASLHPGGETKDTEDGVASKASPLDEEKPPVGFELLQSGAHGGGGFFVRRELEEENN